MAAVLLLIINGAGLSWSVAVELQDAQPGDLQQARRLAWEEMDWWGGPPTDSGWLAGFALVAADQRDAALEELDAALGRARRAGMVDRLVDVGQLAEHLPAEARALGRSRAAPAA
jgi:hypothetical protein